MAKILINKEAIEYVLETFFKENTHCVKKEIRTSANKIICKFCIERKECRVDIHILKDGIRPVTVGKHHEDSSILLRYLESKGTIDDQVSQQFVIKDITILKDILEYIKTDFAGKIKIEQKDIMEHVNQMAMMYGMAPSQLFEELRKNPNSFAAISQQITANKVNEFLLNNNKFVAK